jgi:hypothetical protein
MNDRAVDDTEVLGLRGPWRRWVDLAPRDRIGIVVVWVFAAVWSALFYLLADWVFGDDVSVRGAAGFAVWLWAILQYQPEILHLWHKLNDDS